MGTVAIPTLAFSIVKICQNKLSFKVNVEQRLFKIYPILLLRIRLLFLLSAMYIILPIIKKLLNLYILNKYNAIGIYSYYYLH